MQEDELPNVHFLCIDAATLPDIFDRNEVDRIYLNFSDPWPKDRHARRRLTSSEFLARYDLFLAPDGRIEFKTDNRTSSPSLWKRLKALINGTSTPVHATCIMMPQ